MEIKEFVLEAVAKAFGVDVSSLDETTNFLKDLNAKSVNYFPLMNELEEEYDLELQYQEFRTNCPTIGDVIKMVEEEA